MNRSPVGVLLFFLVFGVGLAIGGAAYGVSHDPISFAAPAAGGLFVGYLLAKSVRVVAQWERMIVLRLGKFQAVADPGLRLIIPVIDSPLYVEMRTQTVNVEKQQTITQDNVPVVVNGVIFFKVVDPAAAALKVQDYRLAIWRMAQATLRDVVGRLTLDELLSQQQKLEADIAGNVEASSKSWGLHVEAIKLENIEVPEDLEEDDEPPGLQRAREARHHHQGRRRPPGRRRPGRGRRHHGQEPRRDAAPHPPDPRRARPLGVQHRGAGRPARAHRADPEPDREERAELIRATVTAVPTITFASSATRPEITVAVTGPEALLDVCDEAGAPVAFSCRDGNCATCRVEVLAGIELLEPARAEEREVLGRLAAAANQRLACQAVVRAGAGLVRIRWGGC